MTYLGCLYSVSPWQPHKVTEIAGMESIKINPRVEKRITKLEIKSELTAVAQACGFLHCRLILGRHFSDFPPLE